MVGTGRRTWGCTPFSHAIPKVCNEGDSQTGRCGVLILVLIVRAKVMRLEGQAQFARVYERPHSSLLTGGTEPSIPSGETRDMQALKAIA